MITSTFIDPSSEYNDTRVWFLTNDGEFSVKITYQIQMGVNTNVENY